MQEEEVHIVMSDQRMPQITGVELLDQGQGSASAGDPDAVHGVRRPGIDHRGDQPGAHLPVHEEALAARGAARGGAAGRGRVRPARNHRAWSASTFRKKSCELKQRVSALETEVRRLQTSSVASAPGPPEPAGEADRIS